MVSNFLGKAPSYKRNMGKISETWEGSGLYGQFLNSCRIEAWSTAIEKHSIDRASIVDFGCSNGSWARNWVELGFQRTIGIDVNPAAIESAVERLSEAHVGDANFLAQRKDDATIGCNGVVLHILEEAEVKKVFKAAATALKPRGHFVVSVINPDYYVTPNGFKPFMGPNSCTRPLDFHKGCVSTSGLELVDVIGTFINPWFCTDTVFMAGSDALKSDAAFFQCFADLAIALRGHGETRPFSEVLLVCYKR